jgi:hypothetical protein
MKRKQYSQNEKTTLQSKRKDHTIVKRKRQHYSQKRKDNTKVKRKRQHHSKNKKTTL